MDFIYILLSVYIRLFQTALPLSVSATETNRQSSQQWAMWLPIIGWVSVSVRYAPAAIWLIWRVTSIRRLGKSRWNVRQGQDRYSSHLRKKRHRENDVPADEMHLFERV